MNWVNYEKALELLEENEVENEYFGGCSEQLIQIAKETLGLKFSKTYRHFIKKYGAGVFATYFIGLQKKTQSPNLTTGTSLYDLLIFSF